MKRIILILIMVNTLSLQGQNIVVNKTQYNVSDFAVNCLLSLKMDSIEVDIIAYHRMIYGQYSALTYRDGKKYVILMLSTMDYSDTQRALAHELIHVSQFRTGRLKILTSGEMEFDNKIYSPTEGSHNRDPQEIEAVRIGNKLFKQFENIF